MNHYLVSSPDLHSRLRLPHYHHYCTAPLFVGNQGYNMHSVTSSSSSHDAGTNYLCRSSVWRIKTRRHRDSVVCQGTPVPVCHHIAPDKCCQSDGLKFNVLKSQLPYMYMNRCVVHLDHYTAWYTDSNRYSSRTTNA